MVKSQTNLRCCLLDRVKLISLIVPSTCWLAVNTDYYRAFALKATWQQQQVFRSPSCISTKEVHGSLVTSKTLKSTVYLFAQYRGTLPLGSSLSLASPPNRKHLLATRVKLCPIRGQGGKPFLGALGFSFFHSQRLAWMTRDQRLDLKFSNVKSHNRRNVAAFTWSSYRLLVYLPNSTMPPKTSIRVPSQTKPWAAQPGGMSPLTAGRNHCFETGRTGRYQPLHYNHVLTAH